MSFIASQQMLRCVPPAGNQGGNDGARNHRRHQEGVLFLRHDPMGETIERRNRAEGQTRGHQKRVVSPLISILSKQSDDGIEPEDF